jgi:hypothetical protein
MAAAALNKDATSHAAAQKVLNAVNEDIAQFVKDVVVKQ